MPRFNWIRHLTRRGKLAPKSVLTLKGKKWRMLGLLCLWMTVVTLLVTLYMFNTQTKTNTFEGQKKSLTLQLQDDLPKIVSVTLPSVRDENRSMTSASRLNEVAADNKNAATTVTNTQLFRHLFKANYEVFPLGIGSDNIKDGDRYLIYRCDNDRLGNCGGLADRFRGMMSAYIIANLTGRVFKSEMKIPSCDLRDYIGSHLVNWTLSSSFHQRVIPGPDVKVINFVDSYSFHSQIRQLDFNILPQIGSKYIYFKSNLDHMREFRETFVYREQLRWMQSLSSDQINAAVFKRLFKLSPRLQRKMDMFLTQSLPFPDGKLVCAHVRTGGNPSLLRDTVRKDTPYSLPVVWQFISWKVKDDDSNVFFMSDSIEAVQLTKEQSFSKHLALAYAEEFDLKLNSTDRNETDVQQCQAFERVVFDMFVLLHCDTLVISKSGISRLAAYVRGSDVGLYCLVDRSVLPCQRHEISNIYKVLGR